MNGLGPDLLAGGDDDGGALQAEALGDGEADPLRRRRHDGHLPLQTPAPHLHGIAAQVHGSRWGGQLALFFPLAAAACIAPAQAQETKFVAGPDTGAWALLVEEEYFLFQNWGSTADVGKDCNNQEAFLEQLH